MHPQFRYRSPLLALASLTRGARMPNVYDCIVIILLFGTAIAVIHGAHAARAPLEALSAHPISLEPWRLAEYGLRTTLRMFAALIASFLFTLIFATWAVKSIRAEKIIIPALDILQSVPVLGFMSFTVTFFLGLFPGKQLGAECAAIFAIFTSQAWNMAFSFYQSLLTVPRDLQEVSNSFGFSAWLRFWRLEAPFAMPSLIWNMMMSMSGGWFFVIACEAIAVGDTTVTLPGIGSYLGLAIQERNFTAVAYAVGAMAILIILYDQLFFRVIVAWSDKFRVEQTAGAVAPRSWLYDFLRRTSLLKRLAAPFGRAWLHVLTISHPRKKTPLRSHVTTLPHVVPTPPRNERFWKSVRWIMAGIGTIIIFWYCYPHLSLADVGVAFTAGVVTFLRVVVLIAIASVIWVPIGVWIGLRPTLAQHIQPFVQFLAAFPANVLFPVAVVIILKLHLNANIWLSPLMILGTQWYILFNVIAGASVFPTDLREVAQIYRLQGTWTWWKNALLPGIFPYYITGALTAMGGSWNASIVAEIVSWGDAHLQAFGLGSYITNATTSGNHYHVALGVAVMSLFVTLVNRYFWRPLYKYAQCHWE